MNIGISIFNTAGAHIFSNGVHQHVGFLVDLLKAAPGVQRVFLLNTGDADVFPESLGFSDVDAPLVKPADVTHELDLVIEMGGKLPIQWLRRVEALGTRIVWFQVGHTYANAAEAPIFKLQGATPFNGAPLHEVWCLPHHQRSCGPMLKTVLRVPVVEVPLIWSPRFLDPEIARCETKWQASFGFRHSRQAWNVAIFEPNISVVKSSFIPMLVCESAYRADPSAVNVMRVMNTFHMKEHLTFNRFASSLDLTRDSRASYEPRVSFAEAILSQKIDAVVAHQWECDLNFAYCDALHGGYPLIHNSDHLREEGVGLFYPGFSAIEGGNALLRAHRESDEFWQAYGQRARAYLDRMSPLADANVDHITARLNALCGART
jgi:hypothetical protein